MTENVVSDISLSIVLDLNFYSSSSLLRSTKEDRFLISWATCDRVGVLCTQAKADPCFFVRSAGRSSFQRHFE